MIHRSMRNDLRVADELYIQSGWLVLEDFVFILSLIVLLYGKGSYDFETASGFVLSLFSQYAHREPLSCFQFNILVINITSTRPRPLHYSSGAYTLLEISANSGMSAIPASYVFCCSTGGWNLFIERSMGGLQGQLEGGPGGGEELEDVGHLTRMFPGSARGTHSTPDDARHRHAISTPGNICHPS